MAGERSAILSPCGLYRYRLTRELPRLVTLGGGVAFVMLNPSTADAHVDDPTIRRCLRFARDWGYERLDVVNLYALRATDPQDLRDSEDAGVDPIGPENDRHVTETVRDASLVVCAWGGNAKPDRARHVVNLILAAGKTPHALKLTKLDRQPAHPLYLPALFTPQPLASLEARA